MVQMVNAAFTGGGVTTVGLLGALSKVKMEFKGYSGASIGGLNAICLAAEKTPEEVRDFLADNVEEFCKAVKGNFSIQKKVDEFLNYQLFSDLPKECLVSITPLRPNFPNLITRENSEGLTCGKVAALTATLPGLFLPGFVKLNGKRSLVLDGGITFNPPLTVSGVNVLFTFEREGKKPSNMPWEVRKREQEEQADHIVKIYTQYGTLGKREDVLAVYEEGKETAKILR